jgi:hypothetical protein
MWGLLICAAALVVVLSTFYKPLQPVARGIGATAAILSGIAIALGLLAGTIGGSFRMSPESATLLTCLGLLCIFGIVLSKSGKKQRKHSDDAN